MEKFIPLQIYTDEAGTGMPLPIYTLGSEGQPTWHHAIHVKEEKSRLTTRFEKVLKQFRMQLVDQKLHNEVYHYAFNESPPPDDVHVGLGLLVLNAGGYIPSEAIDFRGRDNPFRRRLKRNEQDQMHQRGHFVAGSPNRTRFFIRDHVLDMAIDMAGSDSTSVNEQMRSDLLQDAIREAVHPIAGTFKAAVANGFMPERFSSGPAAIVENLVYSPDDGRVINKMLEERLPAPLRVA